MNEEVKLNTLVSKLPLSPRLAAGLAHVMAYKGVPYDELLVSDFLSMPPARLRERLLRTNNVGRVTVDEWETLTAHLRDDLLPKTEDELETEAEYRALRRVRVALRNISGLHKQLAHHYDKLADAVLPQK